MHTTAADPLVGSLHPKDTNPPQRRRERKAF
jgi:hypothetical protein